VLTTLNTQTTQRNRPNQPPKVSKNGGTLGLGRLFELGSDGPVLGPPRAPSLPVQGLLSAEKRKMGAAGNAVRTPEKGGECKLLLPPKIPLNTPSVPLRVAISFVFSWRDLGLTGERNLGLSSSLTCN
jgi:hypothetical protein